MPISHPALSSALGFSKKYIRLALSGRKSHPPEKVLGKIARAIPEIENRAITFPYNHGGLLKNGKRLEMKCIRLDPPDKKRWLSRIAVESAWSIWSHCVICDGNKFLPITLNENPHVACYHCFPPSQYGQIGAREVKKSLIHEALKAFY